jgi:hypothetical protein
MRALVSDLMDATDMAFVIFCEFVYFRPLLFTFGANIGKLDSMSRTESDPWEIKRIAVIVVLGAYRAVLKRSIG